MKAKKSPRSFWTEALTLQEGVFTRNCVVRSDDGAEVLSSSRPLIGDGGRTSLLSHNRQTTVNWNLTEEHRGGHTPLDKHLVQLRPDRLRHASGTSFPVPLASGSQLFEFDFEGRRYVVDSITLIQRLVALDPGVFTTLMSPFRELSLRARRVAWTVYMTVDVGAMKEEGYQSSALTRYNASSVAYWMSSEERQSELDLCGLSILNGGELHVPQVDCPLLCEVRGMVAGDIVYVQSLMPNTELGTSFELAWQAEDTTAIHFLQGKGKVGRAFVFDRREPFEDAACGPRVHRRSVVAQKLSDAESVRIAEVLPKGW